MVRSVRVSVDHESDGQSRMFSPGIWKVLSLDGSNLPDRANVHQLQQSFFGPVVLYLDEILSTISVNQSCYKTL